MSVKKPHKHAELIKAWAGGAEIEYKDVNGDGTLHGAIDYWLVTKTKAVFGPYTKAEALCIKSNTMILLKEVKEE